MTKTTKKPIAKKTDKPSIKDLQAKLARAMADYANLEKRFERDSSHVIKFATSNLVQKLLTLRDHLDLSEQSLNDQGVSMLLTELDKIIADEGVIKIDTSKSFDPSCMECSELVDGDKDQIITTTRVGYKLHDRVLRHAGVTMGNGKLTEPRLSDRQAGT